MGYELGERRAIVLDISDTTPEQTPPLDAGELSAFTEFDQIYRTLCALMYNYVPMSGHPGGSISSGRFVEMILFASLDYDFSEP